MQAEAVAKIQRNLGGVAKRAPVVDSMADGGPPTGVGGEPGVSWPRDTALDRWTVLKEGGNLNLAGELQRNQVRNWQWTGT